MNDESKLVWSDESGDLRKSKEKNSDGEVNEADVEIHLRRLSSGKGRVIIELSNLPSNKSWCKKLAKEVKKKLACGGAYKNDVIEIHGELIDKLQSHLDSRRLKWKKIGG